MYVCRGGVWKSTLAYREGGNFYRFFAYVLNGRPLIINQGKTRVMATDKRELNIHIEGSKLKQLDHIQYLVATITEDGGNEEDMRARMGMAKKVLSGMRTIWKNKGITTLTK